MIKAISEFAGLLRKAEIPVSTAEVLDCAQALQWIDPGQRGQLQTALQSTLIKSLKHIPRFEQLFEMYFVQANPQEAFDSLENTAVAATRATLRQYLGEPPLSEEQKNLAALQTQALNPTHNPDPSREITAQLLQYLLNEDAQIVRAIEDIERNLQAPSASPQARNQFSGLAVLAQRLRFLQSIDDLKARLEEFFQSQIRAASDITTQQDFFAERNRQIARLRVLTEMAMGIRNRAAPNVARISRQAEFDPLQTREKSIQSLTPSERENLMRLMKMLIRKVNTAQSLRFRQARRGKLNVQKTFRDSLHFGGEIMRVIYRKKIRRKGNLVILCDVSGSVYAMAKVMLTLMYSIAQQFTLVRSFAFVDGVAEITTFFKDAELDEIMSKSLDVNLIQGRSNSDYGRSLREFSEEYLKCVGSRTTVIIFGDARNNGNKTEHHLLEGIAKRAKRVIWLNPEDSRFWNRGDSEVRAYQPYCTEFRECRTYQQLEEFVMKL